MNKTSTAGAAVLAGLVLALGPAFAVSAEEVPVEPTTQEVAPSPDIEPTPPATTPTPSEVDTSTVGTTTPEVTTVTEAGPADTVRPVTATPTPAFSPYQVSVSWVLPHTWAYKTTPTYQAAIFPQTRATSTLTCGTWYQNDVYLIEDKGDEKVYLSLGDTLTMGEDSSIYLSHTFTKTPACGPVTVELPTIIPTPPSCDLPGGYGFDTSIPAQNPNGYEQPGKGYRIYVSPALAGPGVYTLTIQKIGAGFDPAFPYGTKVTGQTSQTITVLPATGYQNSDASAPCYVAPQPPVDVTTDWVDVGEPECGDTTIEQTRIVTTTQRVFDPATGAYSDGAVSSATETRTRTLEGEEVTECPVVVPEPPVVPETPSAPVPPTVTADALAYTGADLSLVGWALALLAVGGGFIGFRRIFA